MKVKWSIHVLNMSVITSYTKFSYLSFNYFLTRSGDRWGLKWQSRNLK